MRRSKLLGKTSIRRNDTYLCNEPNSANNTYLCNEPFHLLIGGTGEDEEGLKKLAEELDIAKKSNL